MPLLLLLFVFWLAMRGRLGVYADFATIGPGIKFPSLGSAINSIASPSSTNAAGAAGVPNSAYGNPALYPSTVAKGQGQVQGSYGNPPLSQSPPNSGQRASVWPFQ